MTVYTKSMMEALAEVRDLKEDNMDLMRKAAGGAAQTIKMKDGKLKMDSFTASAIMKVFDKVNPANQKKMAQMINQGTKGGIMKLQDFAMKQVKSGYGEETELDEGREKLARQLIDPKKEEMIVKNKKVIVIDKKDLAKYEKQGWELAEQNEAYELGTDEYREYLEKLTPGEMDEASARADAMKAMRKGKEVDPADVDTDASDDDVKAASKNIIMQMRKAVSLRGNFPVEFGDGKKVKIPAKVGQAVQDKYNSLKKPADKEKFQSQVAKSYKDMLKVLKAGYMMKAAYEEVELDEKRDMSAPPVSAKVVEDEGFRLVMKFKDGTTEALPNLGKPSMQNLKGIVDKNILKNPRRKAWVPVVSAAMKKGPVKEETELDEMSPKDKILKKTSDHLQALIKGSNLPDDNAAFSAVRDYVEAGNLEIVADIVKKLDTSPKEAIINAVAKGMGKKEAEKLFKVRITRIEEVELDEAKYDLYHKDFSSAMQHAYKMAKKLHGITVDPKEIDDKVASGPRKPSEGKTNSYRLKGDKGAIQVQVYNKGGSKPYELNFYKEEVELDEATPKYNEKSVDKEIEKSGIKKGSKQAKLIHRLLKGRRSAIGADIKDEVELDESEFDAMAYGKKDQRFVVKPRDTKGMRGKQDQFKMYVVKIDNRGNEIKVIKDLGSHSSIAGAKKFAVNRGIIKEKTILERIDRKLKERKNG